MRSEEPLKEERRQNRLLGSQTDFLEAGAMNDSMRRGGGDSAGDPGWVALWWAGSGAPASASPNDAMVGDDRGGAEERCRGERCALEARIAVRKGRVDLRASRRRSGRDGISARVPAGAGDRRCVRGGERGDDAFHGTRLGIFPESRARNAVPKIDAEYQQELQGIVEGLRAGSGRSWMWTTSWRSMRLKSCRIITCPG